MQLNQVLRLHVCGPLLVASINRRRSTKEAKKILPASSQKTLVLPEPPAAFLKNGSSLYHEPNVIASIALAKTSVDTASSTSSSQLARGPDSEDDDAVQAMEDASTIEILNDAQGEYRTLDLNVQLMISRIVLEISVVKVKNRKQSRNSLNDSKWNSRDCGPKL